MPVPDARTTPRWSALAKEITLILVVKALALYLIWLAFFSSPVGRHLEAGSVAKSVLNAPAPQVQPQEADRAARPGPR